MTCNRIPVDTHCEHRIGDAVQLGSRVRIQTPWGEEEYAIVSPASADPHRGRISTVSPVGSALLGLRRGQDVSVRTPGGVQRLAILDVVPPTGPVVPARVEPCAR
jgi:transcription elongation GreA/GreB family factor